MFLDAVVFRGIARRLDLAETRKPFCVLAFVVLAFAERSVLVGSFPIAWAGDILDARRPIVVAGFALSTSVSPNLAAPPVPPSPKGG